MDARKDRDSASVVKADPDGNCELVKTADGVTWLLEDIPAKVGNQIPVVVDQYGPLAPVADDLERAGMMIVRLDSIGVRKACGRFYDALADQKPHIRTDPRLDDAVKSAAHKTTADSWAWHREAPGGETLMALSLAYSQATTEKPWEPMVSWA
jgi:hypothetical protein